MMPIYVFAIASMLYFSSYANGQCDVMSSGVSNKDKNQIVHLHNNARTYIASGEFIGQLRGINLKRMRWDSKLATGAQRLAKSCILTHQKVTDGRWRTVGQNLLVTNASRNDKSSDWTVPMTAWLAESANYKYPNGFSKDTRHFTQIVWAETKYIGCGFASFRRNGKYQKAYVCNYGPGGNTGGPPYRTGKSGCEKLC